MTEAFEVAGIVVALALIGIGLRLQWELSKARQEMQGLRRMLEPAPVERTAVWRIDEDDEGE